MTPQQTPLNLMKVRGIFIYTIKIQIFYYWQTHGIWIKLMVEEKYFKHKSSSNGDHATFSKVLCSFALMITNFVKYCLNLTYVQLLECGIWGIQIMNENSKMNWQHSVATKILCASTFYNTHTQTLNIVSQFNKHFDDGSWYMWSLWQTLTLTNSFTK